MSSNGQDPLAQPLAGLRAVLAGQEAEENRIRAELAACQDQTRRIRRAVEALAGSKPGPGRPRKGTDTAGRGPSWTITEATVERVLAALRTQTEPIRVRDLADAAGTSTESVRRAIRVLRERDLARLAEVRTGRGSPAQLFSAMPEPSHAA